MAADAIRELKGRDATKILATLDGLVKPGIEIVDDYSHQSRDWRYEVDAKGMNELKAGERKVIKALGRLIGCVLFLDGPPKRWG